LLIAVARIVKSGLQSRFVNSTRREREEKEGKECSLDALGGWPEQHKHNTEQ
jgi:hypothetical protein